MCVDINPSPQMVLSKLMTFGHMGFTTDWALRTITPCKYFYHSAAARENCLKFQYQRIRILRLNIMDNILGSYSIGM